MKNGKIYTYRQSFEVNFHPFTSYPWREKRRPNGFHAVILKGWIHREKIYVQVDFVDANLERNNLSFLWKSFSYEKSRVNNILFPPYLSISAPDFSSFFVHCTQICNCRTKFTFALPTSRASISVLITTAARSIKCWPERLNCPIISSRNAS